ncbi:MAG: hypothetical protein AAFX80_12405, partial [Cyanobacteria bacterium J06639_18]
MILLRGFTYLVLSCTVLGLIAVPNTSNAVVSEQEQQKKYPTENSPQTILAENYLEKYLENYKSVGVDSSELTPGYPATTPPPGVKPLPNQRILQD